MPSRTAWFWHLGSGTITQRTCSGSTAPTPPIEILLFLASSADFALRLLENPKVLRKTPPTHPSPSPIFNSITSAQHTAALVELPPLPLVLLNPPAVLVLSLNGVNAAVLDTLVRLLVLAPTSATPITLITLNATDRIFSPKIVLIDSYLPVNVA